MFQKTGTPSLVPFSPGYFTRQQPRQSVPLSGVHLAFTGVRVGRSEASCHGHGTEAYRDRAGSR